MLTSGNVLSATRGGITAVGECSLGMRPSGLSLYMLGWGVQSGNETLRVVTVHAGLGSAVWE